VRIHIIGRTVLALEGPFQLRRRLALLRGMPDVLLLELDGVLLDLAAPRRDLMRRELAAVGIRLDESELADLLSSHGLAGAAAAVADRADAPLDATAVELLGLRAERALEAHLASGASLLPGAARFVTAAQGQTRLALATAAPRRRVDRTLALAGLADAFETIVTADDVLDLPPSPSLLQLAVERLARRRAVAPARALVLAGTRAGIRAARGAGLRVVAVGAIPPHVAVEADGYLATLEDLTPGALDGVARRGARVP
jgi:beta-phosphoglucomutase-like phosphatase (HAD superfamily)